MGERHSPAGFEDRESFCQWKSQGSRFSHSALETDAALQQLGFSKKMPVRTSNLQNCRTVTSHILRHFVEMCYSAKKETGTGSRYWVFLSTSWKGKNINYLKRNYRHCFSKTKQKITYERFSLLWLLSSKNLPFKVVAIYNCSLGYSLDSLKGSVLVKRVCFQVK